VRQRTLWWNSWAQLLVVLINAVVGGITVWTGLNPYVVAGHFMAAVLLLTSTAISYDIAHRHRARTAAHPSTARLARAVLAAGVPLVVIGAVLTGAGPRPGDSAAMHRLQCLDQYGGRLGGSGDRPGPQVVVVIGLPHRLVVLRHRTVEGVDVLVRGLGSVRDSRDQFTSSTSSVFIELMATDPKALREPLKPGGNGFARPVLIRTDVRRLGHRPRRARNDHAGSRGGRPCCPSRERVVRD
jgi:hypothetical protein